MACKIRVLTNKSENNEGVWHYVLDMKYDKTKPVDRIFLDEEEAEKFVRQNFKTDTVVYEIEEIKS